MRKKTIEDYLEIVYKLQKDNETVHTNDIASEMNINPSSVTEILGKLKDEGYINYKKYGGASLTKKGLKLAIKTTDRHNTLKDFLILIGVNENIAEMDACEMEHILHKNSMDAIIKFVEIIKKCGFTPFWLHRLKKYIETDKIIDCPKDLEKYCKKYIKK